MIPKLGLLSGTVLLALMLGTPASAAPLVFTISGTNNASFQLDSNPLPSSSSDYGFLSQSFFNNVAGVYSGVAGVANINFGTGLAATFNLSNATLGSIQLNGPAIFAGSSSAPLFSTGTFSLSNPFAQINDTLTISAAPSVSAAPEPGIWMLMLGGVGVSGVALRCRRRAGVADSAAA